MTRFKPQSPKEVFESVRKHITPTPTPEPTKTKETVVDEVKPDDIEYKAYVTESVGLDNRINSPSQIDNEGMPEKVVRRGHTPKGR